MKHPPCRCPAHPFPHRPGRECDEQEFAEPVGMAMDDDGMARAEFDRSEAREINRENRRAR